MPFLLQIYAPIFDREDTFHRTVFLFVSPEVHSNPPHLKEIIQEIDGRTLSCRCFSKSIEKRKSILFLYAVLTIRSSSTSRSRNPFRGVEHFRILHQGRSRSQ